MGKQKVCADCGAVESETVRVRVQLDFAADLWLCDPCAIAHGICPHCGKVVIDDELKALSVEAFDETPALYP